jgi:hypothetical protein
VQEDFANLPAASGWAVFGDTNLFQWNPTAANVSVTWDSARSNSYFYRSLGTILAKDDDFLIAFDLRLLDITTTTKPGPFQIAVGLIGFSDATRSGFWRGSGVNTTHGPRNIFEFDYFPAGYYPGYGSVVPSASPTLVSIDNGFASGFDFLELTNGQLYHIEMAYTASDSLFHTTLSCEGVVLGPLGDVSLGGDFTDFRLDTVAICSYSDAGDDYDSVLAHGTIDNLVVRLPAPPIQNLAGGFSNGVWQVQFASRSNWVYTVDRTTDLQTWDTVSGVLSGDGARLRFQDPQPADPAGFYRVSARRQ